MNSFKTIGIIGGGQLVSYRRGLICSAFLKTVSLKKTFWQIRLA
ncbi:hypothetical protein SAG0054_07765 [Streptococcus agalactiae CCUG 28551]|nr:hypothetical protein SAG0054_07765 [Streptococcus agalactiae CCUG 28551]